MPGDRMTRTAELDPAAVRVVEDYLAELAERMPAHAPLTPDMVAELRDHLVDTTVALIPDSPSPVAAARGAVADFGDVETVAGAMQPELAERKARRIGIALFATGPLVGGCWLAAVFLSMNAASAWRWLPILVAPVLLIGAPASVLTVASSGRMSRRLSPCTALAGRAVTVAGAAAAVGDLILLAGSAVLLVLPGPLPAPLPLALAVGASVARLAFVARAMRRLELRGPLRPPTVA